MKEETPPVAEQDDSLIRQKLRQRLPKYSIPDYEHARSEEERMRREVLDQLPEDLVSLLDEDVLTESAELKAAKTLELALTRFANNTYSLHVDDSKIVVVGGIDNLPTKSMMLNVAVRGDCDYKVYPADTGWSLTIPKKFLDSSVIPTLPSSPTPLPPSV